MKPACIYSAERLVHVENDACQPSQRVTPHNIFLQHGDD